MQMKISEIFDKKFKYLLNFEETLRKRYRILKRTLEKWAYLSR